MPGPERPWTRSVTTVDTEQRGRAHDRVQEEQDRRRSGPDIYHDVRPVAARGVEDQSAAGAPPPTRQERRRRELDYAPGLSLRILLFFVGCEPNAGGQALVQQRLQFLG